MVLLRPQTVTYPLKPYQVTPHSIQCHTKVVTDKLQPHPLLGHQQSRQVEQLTVRNETATTSTQPNRAAAKNLFSEVFTDPPRRNRFRLGQGDISQYVPQPQSKRQALLDIEEEQQWSVGPQWQIAPGNRIELVIAHHMKTVTKALSGVENGTTQAVLGCARYDEVGSNVLHRVVRGLSRTIDTSKGPGHLLALDSHAARGERTAQAGASETSIRNSTVPIFAVCYSGDIRRTPGREELIDLHTGLHVLTGGRRARICLGCLASQHFSPGARWQAIALLPFAFFPVLLYRRASVCPNCSTLRAG